MGRCTVSTVSTLWCLFICLNTHFSHWQTCYRMRRCTDPRCPSWPRAPRIPSQRQEAGSKIRSSPPCGWALKMDGEQIHPPLPPPFLMCECVCVCIWMPPPPPPATTKSHALVFSWPCVFFLSICLSSLTSFPPPPSHSSLFLPLLSAPSNPPNPPPLTPHFVVVWLGLMCC